MTDNLYRVRTFCKVLHVFGLTFAMFIILSPFAWAYETPVNRLQSTEARALTVEAIKHIDKGQWEKGRKKIAQSRDPLASKIYHWMLLTRGEKTDWTNQLFIRLSHFIRQNPEWPGISKMIKRAETAMPEELSNAEVIAWYDDFEPKTIYGVERYMDAMIIEGHKDEAKEFFANWWGRVTISRGEQKKLYTQYKDYVTSNAHKLRLDTLLHAKNYDNARAIAKLLQNGYPELTEARIALAKNKNYGLSALISKVPDHLQNDPGLLYERLRWRRLRDLDKGALEILSQTPPSEKIKNKKAWWKERHILIRRLLEEKRYEEAYNLARNHVQTDGFSFAQAHWMAGWLALRFMNRPTEAYERFSVLYHKVSTPVSKARAAYWAGRASVDLGQDKMANEWYEKAAQFHTVFYGQLAGSALSYGQGLPKNKLPKVSREDAKYFSKNEMMQSALLFQSAALTDTSNDFMSAFLKQENTPKAHRFAAELMAQSGDYYSAIQIAKKAARTGLFLTKQSYPTITKQIGNIQDAEWALIHSIIRQESMFDPKAVSSAGARGLMQLMPATAKGVSKKLDVSYKKGWLTSRPRYNIRLGASYISYLVDRYDGNYMLAIAAYNAGPSRVDSWVRKFGNPSSGQIDPIDWIELMPVYETRNYVQRVLENVYIYRLTLKNIQRQPKNRIHVDFHIVQ